MGVEVGGFGGLSIVFVWHVEVEVEVGGDWD